ncbi:MAG: protoporphyrinogen oxidase [Verrucomicrobia bacterium]|jgi:oxygen-dependent protoporphyrinogen oxidase|nr:protoporphyrinogen oxidase [Verrucomicrobiota bacterium]
MPAASPPSSAKDIDSLVVGAGISGLAHARIRHDKGQRVHILDTQEEPGGSVRSFRREGFLVEEGPNSMLVKSQEVWDWLGKMGLGSRIVEANPAANRRYLVKDGRLVAMPSSPWSAVKTPLYSPAAKLRLLAEPFLPRTKLADESVTSFVSRRMGPEFLEYGISALVSGIFAGDPDRLSLTHAFPKVWNLEQTYGSLIGGALRLRRHRRKAGIKPFKSRLISFRDGLAELTAALAQPLLQDGLLSLSSRLGTLRRDPDGHWHVRVLRPDGERVLRCREVVVTIPLHQYGEIPFLRDLDLAELTRHPYPPLSTLVLGFPRTAIQHPLDGFGALFPRREQRFSLGTIFSSTLFPLRAPQDQVSLMTFIGGVRQPDNARMETPQLVERVLADLSPLLGLRGDPSFLHHSFWPQAIPQYNVGHGEVLAQLDQLETRHPGLRLRGNFRGGPGLHDCLAGALAEPSPTAA